MVISTTKDWQLNKDNDGSKFYSVDLRVAGEPALSCFELTDLRVRIDFGGCSM
jgi:hypothetical protein